MLKWLTENGCRNWEQESCVAAVQGSHLEVLKWAVIENKEYDWWRIGYNAICADSLTIVKWLVVEGHPVSWTKLVLDCSENGDFIPLPILQYLKSKRYC